jgi:hypothetical protein
MQIKLLLLLIVLCTCISCAPKQKCSGALVFDDTVDSCTPCPKDATFKDGTCICKAGYNYVNLRCVKADAGMMETEDAGPTQSPDSGMMTSGGGASCQDYCSFSNECIGMNALAGALGSLAADLHAEDTATCKTSCQSELGSMESSSAALTCFKSSDRSMCKDPNPQNGLKAAFGVIEECCGTRTSDPLCKSICTTLKASPLVGSMITFCP